MKTNFSKAAVLILLTATIFLSNYCQHKMPEQPEAPCKDNKLAEDTTRVYFRTVVDAKGTIVLRDTLPIYPKMIFARFYPWIKDTTKIRQLAEKQHLQLRVPPSIIDQQLCATDGRRAEYQFTPYGKEGFCNFGADSLVEYSFGIFADGYAVPTGNIVIKFVEGIPQTRIDSLFYAEGLRFLRTSLDIPSGKRYWTVVTPRSKKNALDLGYELNFISFVLYASIEIGTVGGNPPLRCDK